MSKEADFIHAALEQSKGYIINTGFRFITLQELIVSIGCSRTKFYGYFGSFNAFLMLLLQEEWAKMFVSIQKQLEDDLSLKALVKRILTLRNEHIHNSRLLLKYCEEREFFTNKFQPIDEAVIDFDDSMLSHLLADYYQVSPTTILENGLDALQFWKLVVPFNMRNDLSRIFRVRP